jgi:hypothetical protein
VGCEYIYSFDSRLNCRIIFTSIGVTIKNYENVNDDGKNGWEFMAKNYLKVKKFKLFNEICSKNLQNVRKNNFEICGIRTR